MSIWRSREFPYNVWHQLDHSCKKRHLHFWKRLLNLYVILGSPAITAALGLWLHEHRRPVSYWFLLFGHCAMSDSVTPQTAAHQASLSFTISRSLLKSMSTESVVLSNNLICCLPLLLLPSVFPNIKVFSNGSGLRIRWPKYWSFSISTFNEYSGLISSRMDGLDLLAAQGTLKSLLQHHSRSIALSIFKRHSGIILYLWNVFLFFGKGKEWRNVEEQDHVIALLC